MLRIIPSTSAGQAKSYFSSADYYSEGQELLGQWRGEGAKHLRLLGQVDSQAWDCLCDNLNPQTGDQLTARNVDNRRIGYDFNFHVPKSVSLLYSLSEDDRLLNAFQSSVQETMQEMETEMKTRVRKSGQNIDRSTGNMVWGEFIHFTSRPIDNVPDPHLHAHCFVFNATYDAVENEWKAGQFGDLKRDAPYFEARFHLRLAHKLEQLGLPTIRTPQGWELAGLTAELLQKFSRRTLQIEAQAEKQGIIDPKAKSELGAKTRSRKQKELSMEELRELWRQRLLDTEQNSLNLLRNDIGQTPLALDPQVPAKAIELASDHCFERRSVIPERTLLAESSKRAIGRSSLEQVEQAYAQKPWLKKERQGRMMVTTSEVLSEEQKLLEFARQGKGTRRPWSLQAHQFKRAWLNQDQRRAVEHVLNSHDRVILIRGAAGVGKTSMMQEAVEAIEATGTKVFTFAPSAKASRGVLRDKGFSEADTLSRLLVDQQLQQELQSQVIWVDEAGLVGSRSLARLFAIAEKMDARVILQGDTRQHGSVERGAALSMLEEQAGLIPVEIKEIQRQQAKYKQLVRELSEGNIDQGFQQLDSLGWIREVLDAERYQVLAQDYLETVQQGASALVVSPTHAEAHKITHEIRAGLKQSGLLDQQSHVVPTLHNTNLSEGERRDPAFYALGDVLIFHQNAKGFTKGQRLDVDPQHLPLDQAARFQVFRRSELEIAIGDILRITQNGKTLDGQGRVHNGDLLHVAGFDDRGNILTQEGKTLAHDFGHLAYGYVSTSHASQGTDVDRVFIGQSAESFPASSAEQFYVSISRGRKQATVYTSSKEVLLEAVRRSDDRITATDLLTREVLPVPLRFPERALNFALEPTKQELTYDR